MGRPARADGWKVHQELDLVPAAEEPEREAPVLPSHPRRGRAPVPRRKRRRASRSSPGMVHQVGSLATTSLVFGLLGLFLCGLLAPLAIMKGNEARRLAIRARVALPTSATAGVALGWTTLGLMAASVAVAAGLMLAGSTVIVR